MRHISLMLDNGTEKDIIKIKDWCQKHKVEFKFRYSKANVYSETLYDDKLNNYYYFYIIGNTKDYKKLKKLMGDKIVTTDFADICNIADLDDEFEEEFRTLIDGLGKANSISTNADRKLLDFVKKYSDINILNGMKEYSGHMSVRQREILDTRIKLAENKKNEVMEEFVTNMLSVHIDVKELRLKTGMNRREFSEYFKIPYRTLEDWENHKTCCSTYLYELMEYRLKNEGLI